MQGQFLAPRLSAEKTSETTELQAHKARSREFQPLSGGGKTAPPQSA